MNTRTKIIIVLIAVAGSFAIGRWSAPVKTKVITTTTSTTSDQKNTNEHKVVTIVETVDKSGHPSKVTTIQDQKDTKENINTVKNTSTTTIKDNSHPLTNISVLAQINQLDNIIYGLSVTHNVLGPFTIGTFAFTDKRYGVSVGLSF